MPSSDESEALAHCDVCDRLMKPKNSDASGHLCRTCLEGIQVGDRIAG